ncbi:MAG: hypothetical protein AABP62_20135 [Planctomycetota bacterium]
MAGLVVNISAGAGAWTLVADALSAGNSVNLGEGTFTPDAPNKPWIMQPNQFLRGKGVGITIVNFTGTNATGDAIATRLTSGAVTNIAISGFTLNGANSQPDTNGIVINGAWESEFVDLEIVNFTSGTTDKGIGFSLLGKPTFSSYRNILRSITCGTLNNPNRIGMRIASPNFGQSGNAGLAYTNVNTLLNCNSNFNTETGLTVFGTGGLELIQCDVESNGNGTTGTGVKLDSCVTTCFSTCSFENNPRPTQVAQTTSGSTVFTLPAGSAGFVNGAVVLMSNSGSIPGGFSAGVPYFVTNVSAPLTFTLSASAGGAALSASTTTTGVLLERRAVVAQTVNATATSAVFTAGSAVLFANGNAVFLVNPPGGFTSSVPYIVINVSGTTFNLASSSGGTAIQATSTVTGVIVQRVDPGTFGADIEMTGATSRTTLIRTHLGSETPLVGSSVGSSGDVYLIARNAITPAADQFTGNWLQKARVDNLSTSQGLFEGKASGIYRVAYFTVRGEAISRFRIYNDGQLEWGDGSSGASYFTLARDPINPKSLLLDGNRVAVVLKGTRTIPIGAVNANVAIISPLTITVTGALTTDTVSVRFAGDALGLTFEAHVSAANTVSFRAINGTGASINLPSGLFEATIIR